MITIATLGPQETFSDLAAKAFGRAYAEREIAYHTSINQIFAAVSNGEAQFGVIPIENVLAGFVQPTLDSLAQYDVMITQELLLPVRFSCISHVKDSSAISKLYVQPVAQGQCEDFINSLEADFIQTSSNIESYHRFMENEGAVAAIVPQHILPNLADTPELSINDVTDYPHNQTRFIVITAMNAQKDISEAYDKTSIIIRDESDHSGILRDITQALAKQNINMLSIISRPTREMMGKYYFFIDLEGSLESTAMKDALAEIEKGYVVQILGSYAKATAL